MAYRVLDADAAHWRRSNLMGTPNTDLGRQLGAETLGARLWRVEPGRASTRHRHRVTGELYVLLEGTGRIRIDDELVTLQPPGAAWVGPEHVRQVFNDTGADQLWLIVGAPTEPADSRRMTEEDLSFHYPDGPRALPPELGGGTAA